MQIGNTPLVQLKNTRIYAKMEGENAGGSIKDRVALAIIEHAENSGLLREGGLVVEATSGNTGIGLALVAKQRGYKAVIVMPDTMSKERQELLKSYGAELVLTDGKLGMQGAVERAKQIVEQTPNAVLADQFNNPVNPMAHYRSTAPEIEKQMTQAGATPHIFVACVGTGGTLSGVGKYLKERYPDIYIVAVEPAASPLLSGGVAGAHKIQGIGANFIPNTLDRTVYDEVVCVSNEEAYDATRTLKRQYGIYAGISSGAAFAAAKRLSERAENKDKNIVTLFPDEGGRYVSTGVFDEK